MSFKKMDESILPAEALPKNIEILKEHTINDPLVQNPPTTRALSEEKNLKKMYTKEINSIVIRDDQRNHRFRVRAVKNQPKVHYKNNSVSPHKNKSVNKKPKKILKNIKESIQKNLKAQQKSHESLLIISKTIKLSKNPITQPGKERESKAPPVINNHNEQVCYKYTLGPGNNVELVKKILDKRPWWKDCSDSSGFMNFRWAQTSRGYHYEHLKAMSSFKQLVNHFEYHNEFTTKTGLFKNLHAHSETAKLNLFDMIPVTFAFDMNNNDFEDELQTFAKIFQEVDHNRHSKNKNNSLDNKENQVQTSKAKSNYNFELGKYFRSKWSYSEKLFPCINQLKYRLDALPSTFNQGMNLWLLKPSGLNRGRGVEVFDTLDQLKKLVQEYYEGFDESSVIPKKKDDSDEEKKNDKNNHDTKFKSPKTKEYAPKIKKETNPLKIKSHTFVIQKYMEKPFLINGRKFDFRVWVLLSHEMNLYMFKEGYIRTSCQEYCLGAADNKFIHLTNNAVQKYAEEYGKYENGNQLSFSYFENYLKNQEKEFSVKDHLIPKMKDLIKISMNSIKKKTKPRRPKVYF